jgi:MoxR-like ATPase
VLRHRIITNFTAESEGVTPDKVVDKLLEAVPVSGPEDRVPPAAAPAFKP